MHGVGLDVQCLSCAPRNTNVASLVPTNESPGMRLMSPDDILVLHYHWNLDYVPIVTDEHSCSNAIALIPDPPQNGV